MIERRIMSMSGMLHDFRYTLRQMRRNPGFAGTAVLVLTL